MAQYERHHVATESDIRTVARTIRLQRGWQLVSDEEMAQRVTALLENGVFDSVPRAILHVYAHALYHACAGDDGPERQQRAFADLFRYLYDVSRRFAGDLGPDEREEIADQSIADIYYRLVANHETQQDGRIHNPGAFLAFAVQQLRNGVRKWRKHAFACWDSLAVKEQAPAADEPEERVVDRDVRWRVRQCFLRTLQRHPRARLQLWVVWRKQIDGLDYAAISAEVGMTVANVRILHSRGLAHLRNDPEWRALGRETGLIEDGAVDHPQQVRMRKGA